MSTITNSTVADLVANTSTAMSTPNDLAKVAAELVLSHPGDLTQTRFHPVDTTWIIVGRLALPHESEQERLGDYIAAKKYADHALQQYGPRFQERAQWLKDAAYSLEIALATEIHRKADNA